jgi:alpha-N-arabinofuranosidase
MRQFDPSLYLVACGSSSAAMPTFGDWERTVLREAYDLVDAISLHAYYEEGDDLASFLASGVDLERTLDQVTVIADEIGAERGSHKRIELVVDEWNVWYLSRHLARAAPRDWPEAPRLCEDAYTLADAVVVGGLLITLLKHADRVALACLAQLVNAIAPIKTEPGGPAWREATFYPFALTAAHARGQVIRLAVNAPTLDTARHGEVPVVDPVATLDDDGALSIFVVNRDPDEHVRLSIDLSGAGVRSVATATVLSDPDCHARNQLSDPARVRPQPLDATLDQHRLQTTLPPVSWAMLRLEQA